MSNWAKPGAKCVCIASNGSWRPSGHDTQPGLDFPAYGDVLVISDTFVRCGNLYLEFPGILDAGFNVECFKPVIEQADDLALFAHHLNFVGEPA
ncbi:hypothetical protein SAMN05216456_1929 [Devosia crocina]|uniref:Uncharacterized protein n=1 Tax=Devosia crocina TaxID=429728 RepID=A0A1I7NEZ6_9HYPH|nr:hypothetical protein [Devosia crocina]SFV33235.1 hypothetical protein SAMN05216456_1929 [Devosia crocina]